MLCSRTRVIMSSEASPLFLRSPLIISFLLCLYDHHFYYNPFNALREINVWTKCGAIDCSIWTLWLSWEERTLAPPMFLFLCVSSLLYCPHWMQKQLLFFRGNIRDYGSYRRLYGRDPKAWKAFQFCVSLSFPFLAHTTIELVVQMVVHLRRSEFYWHCRVPRVNGKMVGWKILLFAKSHHDS